MNPSRCSRGSISPSRCSITTRVLLAQVRKVRSNGYFQHFELGSMTNDACMTSLLAVRSCPQNVITTIPQTSYSSICPATLGDVAFAFATETKTHGCFFVHLFIATSEKHVSRLWTHCSTYGYIGGWRTLKSYRSTSNRIRFQNDLVQGVRPASELFSTGSS